MAVAVVDEFTGKIIYQYTMKYVLNIGVATRGHNMRKCFDDPITNAKEMMCTKIADHDSSGYPHTEWKGDCMIHRTQTSGDIYCEGNDIKYVDLDLFCNYHIPPRNVDGNKNNVFNRKNVLQQRILDYYGI